MDYIVKLPQSHGYDSILVVVDRLSKMAHFVPVNESMTSSDLARIFLNSIFRLHGSPDSIISDRGSTFVSHLWKEFLKLLDIKPKNSTAYHPQTDGQTERVNQVLEQYLRCYCSYQQDDWVDYLPLAEFAYNNSKSSSTQQTPFFANYAYHPSFEPRLSLDSSVPAAADLASRLQTIHAELVAELHHAQDDYAKYYNRHVQPAPPFSPGDLVWLRRRNIKTTRPSDKLDYRLLGPFRILRSCGKLSFQLELPPSMSRLHPVFHVNLLEPYHNPRDIEGRVPPPPPVIALGDDGQPFLEVEKILDVRKIGRRFEYFVHWKDLGIEENSWVALSDMATGLDELIEQFHRRHPQKPRPHSLDLSAIRSVISNYPSSFISNRIDSDHNVLQSDTVPPPTAGPSSSIPSPFASLNPIPSPEPTAKQTNPRSQYTPPPRTTLRSGRVSKPRLRADA
jgi:hypothetical protein